MATTTLTQAIATEINFKFLSNFLVEITLESPQSFFRGYGKVLDNPHMGYMKIMLDNGYVIFLDKVNQKLVKFDTEVLEDYNFTEIYKTVLVK